MLFYHRRKSKKLKIIIFLAIIILLMAVFYNYQISRPASTNPRLVNFMIESGQSSTAISQNLINAELIRSPIFFELYAWLSGSDDKLQPGQYQLPGNLSIKDVLKIITAVKLIKEKQIRIIEGWTLTDIGEYLEQQGIAAKDEFMTAVQHKQQWWDNYNFLVDKPRDVDLEGYLFPDTYRIYEGAKLQTVLVKMLDNFDRKITPELRAEIKKQDKTLHEIITLASILEKEVNAYEDRRTIAGIFYRRLSLGMGLQSDSTLNYVTGVDVARNARENLDLDSPYNTYKYRGLPPGPISNPGLSAIKAAIYPRSVPYLYFLTTPDGVVIYSRTYEEHVAAKAKYYP